MTHAPESRPADQTRPAGPHSAGPAITAILVTYRSRNTIGAALDGLAECQAEGLLRTVVVDNQSNDGCLEFVQQNYPDVHALSSGGNVGFGRGNNIGLRLATTPYVLFLNPDAKIAPADLRHMLEFLEQHPKVGILGPAIRNNGKADQITCSFPTPGSTLGDALGAFGGWKNRQSVIELGSTPRAVDWVCGAVLLVRRDLLQQLEGFDPRFFLYFEETDLCKRALALGFETWTTGLAVADHLPGTSARASADDDGLFRGCIAEHYFRSRYYYLRKHHGRFAAVMTDLVEAGLLAARWLGRRLRGRSKPGELALRLRSPFWRPPQPPEWTEVETGTLTAPEPRTTAAPHRAPKSWPTDLRPAACYAAAVGRCLLLSLSGVRIRDPELTAIGLTLPGFVERGQTIAELPNLGLLTLAAHTPDHWELQYRDVDFIAPWTAEAIAAEGFDLVAISALSARILEAYQLADALRAAGPTVVLGGLHVSAMPAEARAHADAVVVGQAEHTWPLLLEHQEHGQLRPEYRASDAEPFRLTFSRAPRYDLLEPDRYNRLTVQTTRGCPLDCEYCGASRTIGAFDQKPIEHVRRDLEAILAHWPRPFLELADDNTFVDKRRGLQLAELLAEYPVHWFTETDASIGDDPALLDALAGSGCAQLLIGFEAIDASALGGVDRAGFKAAHCQSAAETIARIQDHGITVNGCFILGLDRHGPDVFERTAEFVHQSGLAEVQITLLTPFPGTELHARLQREGRLHQPTDWSSCTLFDLMFEPLGMTAEELTTGFRELMRDLYSDDATERRRTIRRQCLRRVQSR